MVDTVVDVTVCSGGGGNFFIIVPSAWRGWPDIFKRWSDEEGSWQLCTQMVVSLQLVGAKHGDAEDSVKHFCRGVCGLRHRY